jgi:hypothetical protein
MASARDPSHAQLALPAAGHPLEAVTYCLDVYHGILYIPLPFHAILTLFPSRVVLLYDSRAQSSPCHRLVTQYNMQQLCPLRKATNTTAVGTLTKMQLAQCLAYPLEKFRFLRYIDLISQTWDYPESLSGSTTLH